MAVFSATRLDSRESAFFQRECEYIKTRTYDAKPPLLKGLSLVPQASGIPAGTTEITFRRYMEAGRAKLIANYAKDFPRVDVFGSEETVKVKDLGDSYGYNIREIRESALTGKRLDQRRATAARNAIERDLNEYTLLSNKKAGTYGILDFPGLTETTLPADGTGGTGGTGRVMVGCFDDMHCENQIVNQFEQVGSDPR